MRVFVAGAGTMGAGIAQAFVAAGHTVRLCDVKQEYVAKGIANVGKNLSRLVEKGKLGSGERDAALARLEGVIDLNQAGDCELVIEAVIEDMAAKKELFGKLDGICPANTLFATNTSSLSVTEMGAGLAHAGNFIGMHFFNPVPVMKLVEIIRGESTSDAAVQQAKEIATSIDKQAVEVKEAPGFVVNRILIPMINEAIAIWAEGVATAEDIDKAMQLGANHPIGPLALADLIGNDVNLAIMEVLLRETGDPKYRPHPALRKMVRAGRLGRKSGRGFYQY